MKDIRPEEISSLIKEQIKNYDQKIHSDDVGYVISLDTNKNSLLNSLNSPDINMPVNTVEA